MLGDLTSDFIAAPFMRRLNALVGLSDDDKSAILDSLTDARTARPRADLLRADDVIDGLSVVLEGFACRYKLLPDGRRQIVAFLVPGDFCDLRVLVVERADHAVAALAPTTTASITRDRLLSLVNTRPRLSRALWWSTLVEDAILREWLVNVGQRAAIERVSHLLCELYLRLEAVGLAADGRLELPVTQSELGDALGLSTVHINRTLRELRGQGLLETNGKSYFIRDLARLARVGIFSPDYLRVGRDLLEPRPDRY
ncbi:cAMP-binding domain of CRP or a regulatory subunit of cAMP-dependent protein kinases [Devosia enhydra]|uniref:cAMP-binding domain of CRP or a regulatory subunit of cAMP-dependent protein kinases n=1 Tax=Devosia enhydra TaxID=665118 RepID=A0A1K2I0J8_9HYPH|nr:Crp/Fnr family transcriptional regulator [Devosia enhydra]SFZ85807.1 cAMP-binding domain of CRP or a regulatory subunit of cAMP-dependent protein kinases [Devosia enhydra]